MEHGEGTIVVVSDEGAESSHVVSVSAMASLFVGNDAVVGAAALVVAGQADLR